MSSRRLPQLPSLPNLRTYRGRYLFMAAITFVAFAAAGVIGYRQVAEVGTKNLANIQQRAQATASLQDALGLLQKVRNQVGRFLINPPQEPPEQLRATSEHLRSAVLQLRSAQWIRQAGELSMLADSAYDSLFLLESLLDELVRTRANRRLWLPATRQIEEGINPDTLAGQGLMAEMLDELDTTPPNAANVKQRAIINEMRLRWMQAIAEVRLLIANRFGVFDSNTEAGIAARARNIHLYLDTFRDGLAALQSLSDKGELGLVTQERLPALQEIADSWESSVQQALVQLTDVHWRPDLTLVRDDIEPLLNSLQQRFSSLRLELDIESARNITELTEVSRQLTRFAALLIGAGCLFAIIAYLTFDHMLLRPIQHTTQALRKEARGEQSEPPPSSKAGEIRDLLDAFNEMRQQVRQRQAHLDHLAHHDTLTGLPNRLLFRDRLDHALARAQRHPSMSAVLFLDLDGFKKINDTLGHAAGDALLRAAADRLRAAVRGSDTIARLGGDEFAILVEQVEYRQDITRLGEKLLAALETPFNLEGRLLHIGTSIGIAVAPVDGDDPESLTRAADTAMYAAKQAGKGCLRYFTAEMSRQANDYMEMETALRGAIANQAFRLHFQPIVDTRSGALHACEVLLRWQHPELGPVSPAVFVPVLDDMGKLGEVSRWIIAQLGGLQQRFSSGDDRMTLSINLTARLLYDDAFALYLLDQLRADPLAAQHLIIEITEDSLSADLDAAVRVLRELQLLGVRIALDDFGTGQSSLNHLRHFRFDMVKVDREFVRDMPHDPNDVSLVQAIVDLSHAFDMQVVAEGVETEDQEAMLRQQGCDCLQGYRISRPMTSDALEAFLRDHAHGFAMPMERA